MVKTKKHSQEKIRFDSSTAGINSAVLESYNNNLLINQVTEQLLLSRASDDGTYAFVKSIFDDNAIDAVKKMVIEKYEPGILGIVIGIGGSSLGAKAVYNALHMQYPLGQLLFSETVDSDELAYVMLIMRTAHAQGRKVIGIIITKSGTTLESLLNANAIIRVLQELYTNKYTHNLVVITDKNSPLDVWAHDIECSILHIPKNIGGRFSVYTAVGLFPLALAQIPIEQYISGARDAIKNLQDSGDGYQADPCMSAALLFEQYKKGMYVHDTFLFSTSLEDLGKWYRQLLGESIGKEYDLQGKRVNAGFIPTVSMGTQDLHSVAQVYLAGPNITFTTFIAVEKSYKQEIISLDALSFKDVEYVNDKSYDFVRTCLLKGTQTAYTNNQRAFATLTLPQVDAYTLGQCMAFKMCEIIYFATLLNINAFDQPQVESYKKAAQKFMKQ